MLHIVNIMNIVIMMMIMKAILVSVFFSREPSLARYLKSVVQIFTLILAHRPMAQWLPRIIQPFIGSSLVESPFFTQQKKRTHTETTANQRREATQIMKAILIIILLIIITTCMSEAARFRLREVR